MHRRSLLAGLAALPAVARAEDYPSRAVTMVVAFPPGGPGDVVARPIAAGLERAWRHPRTSPAATGRATTAPGPPGGQATTLGTAREG